MSVPEYSIIGGTLTARVNVPPHTFENHLELTEVIFGEGVTHIGYRAFMGCANLEKVTFPKSLERIEGAAFKDCVRLASATLPMGIKSIGRSAFDNCPLLEDVVVPSSVQVLGPSAIPDSAVRPCTMSERPFKTLGTPTVNGNEYTWEDDRIVHVEYNLMDPYANPKGKMAVKALSAQLHQGGKLAAKKNPDIGKVVGTLKKWGEWTEDEDNGRIVAVVGDKDEVEIKLVYLGAGSGLCTKAVASVIYAVVDRLNAENKYPTRGKVYIESKNGCAAFNCYNRAFRMNGYQLTKKSMVDYIYYVKTEANAGIFSHTLKYYSEEQVMKRRVYEDEQGVATYRMYVQRLRRDKQALDRVPILGPVGTIKRVRFAVRADSDLGKIFLKAIEEEGDIERVYQRLRSYLPREWSESRGKAYILGWKKRNKGEYKRSEKRLRSDT